MAQKKAHEVDSWLKRPDPRHALVLLYGPDRGLVAERAKAFAAASGISAQDPFSLVRLDASDIEAAPGRLLEEARMMAMFTQRRLIWIRDAGQQKGFAAEVKALAQEPPPDAVILIEAGDLKKGAALRAAVEGADVGMALPCYADEARSVDALIDGHMAQAGLRISPDARQLLKSQLGGDRLATRGELEKLSLYCKGRAEIGVDDVRAAIGDVSALSVDGAVDAVLAGRIDVLDATLAQILASGTPPFLVLSAMMRQLHALQTMRWEIERNGRLPAQVVAGARPPVFFSRRKLVENALGRWNGAGIASALARLQAAVLTGRKRPQLAAAAARQALLAVLVEGMRGSRDAA